MRWQLLLIAVFAAACITGKATPSLAGTTGEISGTVTDATTHSPIVAARISAVSATSKYVATSNAKGFYAIINVFPDTYTVTASAFNYEPHSVPGNTVNQDQSYSIAFALIPEVKTLDRIVVKSLTDIVQPKVTANQYVLNAQQAKLTNGAGGSAALYTVAGVIVTVPGVTADPFGGTHIHGGMSGETGYEYDGVSILSPIFDAPITTEVTAGLARIEVSTGGYGASAANAMSGLVNVVVGRGSYPGHGGITFLNQTPTFYHGINFDYGAATADQRLSYYVAGIWSNADYDFADRSVTHAGMWTLEGVNGTANPSRDQVANIIYHFGRDEQNELQLLEASGYAHYDAKIRALYYPSNNPPNGPLPTAAAAINGICDNGIALFPGQSSCLQTTGDSTDHFDYNYLISKLQLTRNFSSTSYAVLRLARLAGSSEGWVPFGDFPFNDVWYDRTSNQVIAAAAYANQLNAKHLLNVGFGIESGHNKNIVAFASAVGAFAWPAQTIQMYGFIDDKFQPSANLILTLGLRTDRERYEPLYQPAYSISFTQPRIALADQLNSTTVVRGSYGTYVEMPGTRSIERVSTNFPNFNDVSPGNWYTANATQSPALPFEARLDPTVSHAYDASLERILGKSWSAKITPFWRRTSNLIVTFAKIGVNAQIPQNVGTFDVNGIEIELQRQHAGDGLSGYIDYTHTRTLSDVPSDFNFFEPQKVNLGKKIAQQRTTTDFTSADVANLVLSYRHGRWLINPEINYTSGFPYGVGRTILCFGNEGAGCESAPPGVVTREPNPAFYVNGDVHGTPIDNTEGDDPNSLLAPAQTLVNLNVSYDVSPRTTVGLQMQNLFREYDPISYTGNPYFTSPGDPQSGLSPYGLTYGPGPYTPDSYQGSQEFLFTVSFKL